MKIMTPLELAVERASLKYFLHQAVKNSKLNGAQMRDILNEFAGEVLGA